MNYMECYKKWLDSSVVEPADKEELKKMSPLDIEDSFCRNLEFGTGGLRGIMGLGSNRMNKYTVRLATQGLADEIKCCGEKCTDMGVVIAYDSRNNSAEFAFESAKVLGANGIKTYLFSSLRPTPELSFAVRYLKCKRGIVITASHNPKEYNGYKVYGEDGGQIPPEAAETIMQHINMLDIFADVRLCENSDFITVDSEIDNAYINCIRAQSFNVSIPEAFSVVYTPLHGAGNVLVRRILGEIGVKNLFTVPEQEKPDGNFPTVKSPNPENAEAFAVAAEYAKKLNADIVLGTDPDSDRIGVVVRSSKGEYTALNGNQTGCLLCEYILRKSRERGVLPKNGTVVKTIVTTDMIKDIAEDYGIYVKDVLTGFKFIGEQIKLYEKNGEKDRFIFGLEESFGYLKGTYTRDKDAVVSAMLICEMAADYKLRGMTLLDGLAVLYEKYGFYTEGLKSLTLSGTEGSEKISGIMDRLRKNPPRKIAGFNVSGVIDYNYSVDGLPKSNVLKFLFDCGSLAVRPSGTEPKIKFYYSIKSSCYEKSEEIANKTLEFINSIIQQ